MKTKDVITAQLSSYVKSYEQTKKFEEFKANIYRIILDMEEAIPVSPFFSTYLFRMKMDCENMDQFSAGSVILSLETFLEKLTL